MTADISSRRPLRSLALALSGLVLAAGALLASAAPASAHDELVSTDPAAGTTVEGLPAQISLTYSADILADASATVIQVTDAAGTALTDGAPSVAGNVVTQALTGTASGEISVAWRVVSSDGHPISGEYAFTATAVETVAPTETASPEPTATKSAEPDPVMTILETDAPAPTDEASNAVWPWVVGAAVLVVAIALVVWLLIARARQQKRAADERTAGRGTSSER